MHEIKQNDIFPAPPKKKKNRCDVLLFGKKLGINRTSNVQNEYVRRVKEGIPIMLLFSLKHHSKIVRTKLTVEFVYRVTKCFFLSLLSPQ